MYDKLKLTLNFLLKLASSLTLRVCLRVCVKNVKSGGLRFKQKKKKQVFIQSDAFHTKIQFPDWLGKAVFWQQFAKTHQP